MMEDKSLICIDDKNLSPKIQNKPVEGQIYTLRQLKRNINGTWGVLLNEVHNKPRSVPTDYGDIWLEPNFATFRFQTLDGISLDGIEEDILRENIKKEELCTH